MSMCSKVFRRELANGDDIWTSKRKHVDLNDRHAANRGIEQSEQVDHPGQKKLVRGPTANPDSDGVTLPKFVRAQEEVARVLAASRSTIDPIPKSRANRSPLVQRPEARQRSNGQRVMLNQHRTVAVSEFMDQRSAGRFPEHDV